MFLSDNPDSQDGYAVRVVHPRRERQGFSRKLGKNLAGLAGAGPECRILEFFLISLLNGLSYGLLLFMLSSGLTLIFSMMGVLNFAHASFYLLGAYFGWALSAHVGFWLALLLAPLAVGLLGAWFESACLRRVHRHGHVAELLVTFGLSYVVLELVQLVWGRAPLDFQPPELLRGPAFTLVQHAAAGISLAWGAAGEAVCRAPGVLCHPFPATRAFIVVVALLILLALGWLLQRTRIGLVVQAALTHPEMVEALGHDLPRVFMGVFGAGAALAGLAGVVGGSTFVTEPGMAAAVGPVIFVVVVVGGLGSLAGAFGASLLIALVQTFAVAHGGWLAQVAPMLPYLLLVLVLLLRPAGLFGRRAV